MKTQRTHAEEPKDEDRGEEKENNLGEMLG